MEAVLWSNESYHIHLSPFIFTYNCSLQWIIGLALGFWFCYSIDTGPLLGLLLGVLLSCIMGLL